MECGSMNRALVINADIVIIVSEDIVGQDTLPQFVPKNTAYYIMYCNYILICISFSEITQGVFAGRSVCTYY